MVLTYQTNDAARSLDQQQILDWQRGWQVVDPAGGSNLVTEGTGDHEFDAASGDINTGGTIVSASQETVDFATDIDANDDQMAVIYRDSSGTLQKEIGTTGTRDPSNEDARSTHTPPPPSMFGTDGVVLAEVLLPAGASSLGSNELRDRRLPAELILNELNAQKLSANLDANSNNISGVGTLTTDTLAGLSGNAVSNLEGDNLSVDGSNVLNVADDLPVTAVSSNTTTSGAGIYVVDASGGAITLTLATADVSIDAPIGVVKYGGGNLTVDTEGSETIDPNADASKTITQDGFLSWFTGDGTNYDSSLAAEYDTVSSDTITLTNETFIRATRGSDTSSTTAQTFVNALDGESKDVRGEFNSSAQFVPDRDGEYHIEVSLDMRGSTVSGDVIEWRVEDVDTSTTITPVMRTDAANDSGGPSFSYVVSLTAGTTYEIQATNRTNSFVIDSANTEAVIQRVLTG